MKKLADEETSVMASTRCTPSPFENDLSRPGSSLDPSRPGSSLRTQSAMGVAHMRGSPLPRVADGEVPNLDDYSDNEILSALLGLSAGDQGITIANWANRLERTHSCYKLEQHIYRLETKNAQVVTREVSTQTDIVGPVHLGDTSTDTLRHGIQHLTHQIACAKESLQNTSNDSFIVRSTVREVHTAVFQTAGQADIAATITKKLVGHAARTERRFEKNQPEGMELPPQLKERKEDEELLQGVDNDEDAARHAESSDEEASANDEDMYSRVGSKESRVGSKEST